MGQKMGQKLDWQMDEIWSCFYIQDTSYTLTGDALKEDCFPM